MFREAEIHYMLVEAFAMSEGSCRRLSTSKFDKEKDLEVQECRHPSRGREQAGRNPMSSYSQPSARLP